MQSFIKIGLLLSLFFMFVVESANDEQKQFIVNVEKERKYVLGSLNFVRKLCQCELSSFHEGEYEYDSFLGYSAV
jgi:hypothetical protein